MINNMKQKDESIQQTDKKWKALKMLALVFFIAMFIVDGGIAKATCLILWMALYLIGATGRFWQNG